MAYQPEKIPMQLKVGSEYVPSPGLYDTGSSSFPEYRLSDSGSTTDMISQVSGESGDVAGQAAAIPGPQQPYMAAASLGLKGISTAAGLYGKYQEREDAKKRHEEALARWHQAEKERKERQGMEDQRRSRQEAYFASDFAGGLEDRLASSYGGYATPGGQ